MLIEDDYQLRVREGIQSTTQRRLTEGDSRFHVSYTRHDDNSAVGLPKSRMDELNILQGDFVNVFGRDFATTLNVDMHNLNQGTATLSRDIQHSLGVQPGQLVIVRRCSVPEMIKRIAILPFSDTMEDACGHIFKDILAPYLSSGNIRSFAVLGRPAHRGDLFSVTTADGRRPVQFEVCEMESSLGKMDSGIIGPESIIHCEGCPIERKDRPATKRYELPPSELSHVECVALQVGRISSFILPA